MFRKDKLEKFEYDRDLVEYSARFWNNEAVDKVIEAREKDKELNENEGSKDIFAQQVDELFGRGEEMKAHLSGKKIKNKEEVDDIKIVKKEKRR